MAEIILRSKLVGAGLDDHVQVDSAGTGDWHVGEAADRRTVSALAVAGYDGSQHRARVLEDTWLPDRDLYLVADESHLREVQAMADGLDHRTEVRMLRSFDPEAVAAGTLEVDDPYYGDDDGFERIRAEIERACDGVVQHLRSELRSR